MNERLNEDSDEQILNLREIGQLLLSAIFLAFISIALGESIIYTSAGLFMRTLIMIIGIALYAFSSQMYYAIREVWPIPADPYAPQKTYLCVGATLLLLLSYDFSSRPILQISSLYALNFLSIFYFRRYLLGVDLELGMRQPMKRDEFYTLRGYLKGNWATVVGFGLIYSLTISYLSYRGYFPDSDSVYTLIDLGLFTPSILIISYFLFKWIFAPPTGGALRHLACLHRVTGQYSATSSVTVIENVKTRTKTVGGNYYIILLRLLQDRDPDANSEPWEAKYRENAEDAFWNYVLIAYVTPIVWLLLDLYSPKYAIVPPYDLGLWSVSLLFTGSLFLALEPITNIPETEFMQRPKMAVFSHLGVLLLATGSIYQASGMIPPSSLITDFEMSVLFPTLDRSAVMSLMELIHIVVPYTVVPITVRLVIYHLRRTN